MIEVKLSGKDSQTSYRLQLLDAPCFPIVSRNVISFVRRFMTRFDDMDRYHIKDTSVQNFLKGVGGGEGRVDGEMEFLRQSECRLHVEISDVAILMLLKMIYR